MYTFACKDMGFECEFNATSETKEELMEAAAAHGMEAHQLTEADMTDEMKDKMMSVMQEA